MFTVCLVQLDIYFLNNIKYLHHAIARKTLITYLVAVTSQFFHRVCHSFVHLKLYFYSSLQLTDQLNSNLPYITI